MGDPFVRPGLTYAPHIEHLVLRNPGTGTAGTTPHEWLMNQRKDMLASIVMSPSHLAYISCAENVPPARVQANMLNKLAAVKAVDDTPAGGASTGTGSGAAKSAAEHPERNTPVHAPQPALNGPS